LALLHRGQMLRAGAPSFQAPARWLRVFILDFFFLGTATEISLDEMGLNTLAGGEVDRPPDPASVVFSRVQSISCRRGRP
jgi:hypothetical protein